LRRTRFLHGRTRNGQGVPDVAWFARDGREKDAAHWQDPGNRCFGLMLGARDGEATLLLLANAHDHAVPFLLPAAGAGAASWRLLLDTGIDQPPPATGAGRVQMLRAGTLALLEAATIDARVRARSG
jgi:glycogen operon protein